MFNETYDNYIRNVLGNQEYNDMNSNMYMGNTFQDNQIPQYDMPNNFVNNSQNEIERYYPEIYKVIYPMIKKACMGNMMQITPNRIEELTNEIYIAIESDNMLNVNITIDNEIKEKTPQENRNMHNRNTNTRYQAQSTRNNRGESRNIVNRYRRNKGLEDLIKILLIREFSNNPQKFYNQPYRYPNRYPQYNYNRYPGYRPMYNNYGLYE